MNRSAWLGNLALTAMWAAFVGGVTVWALNGPIAVAWSLMAAALLLGGLAVLLVLAGPEAKEHHATEGPAVRAAVVPSARGFRGPRS